ncbi:hypothetical protein AAVH_13356, partial [Aphelenchoides avenae]
MNHDQSATRKFLEQQKEVVVPAEDDDDGASPSAETRSAPGDLSQAPPAWHHHLHLEQRPGTSQGREAA